MSRPQKSRKIGNPPKMQGFKPFGIPLFKAASVCLKFEEFESIRLVNYEMLPQDKAAAKMNVSRPTLTRIYNKALKIIAQAFVEGMVIEIEGGNYQFEQDWFKCKKCHKLIQGINNHIKCENCLLYNENELINLNLIGQ